MPKLTWLIVALAFASGPFGGAPVSVSGSLADDGAGSAQQEQDRQLSLHVAVLMFVLPDSEPPKLSDPNAYAALCSRAATGDPNAQYEWALCCLDRRDLTETVRWFEKAATQNHAKAQYALSQCYNLGAGVPEDAAKAAAWCRKAAEQGLSTARWDMARTHDDRDYQYALAKKFRRGDGLVQDSNEALCWYTRAAEQGHAEAQFELGVIYASGRIRRLTLEEMATVKRTDAEIPKDHEKAVLWLTKAAEQGFAEAQFNLAVMYYKGEGVPQDYKEAAKWYTKAAEQGDANAQFFLGRMYEVGEGIPKDGKEAVKWYAKAGNQGDAFSHFLIGRMYEGGKGIPQDYGKAVEWLVRAAEKDYLLAKRELVVLYHEGKGDPEERRELARWYTKIAEEGDAKEQFEIAWSFQNGVEAPQDYREAVRWFTRAAGQGSTPAKHHLAQIYHEGQGVPEDYAEAYKWTILATMQDPQDVWAQSLKATLRRKMTPTQIEEGQRAAKELVAAQERRQKGGEKGSTNVRATATGFFITSDGHLLTASHVVAETPRIEVFHQGKSYVAKVVSKDKSLDAAVLKIEGTGFPCLPFVSSAAVKTGDEVFTLGFPQVSIQGTETKFTEGSISALSGFGDSPRFFQISVPVQPGNSGGPLVNEKGEVVGLIVSRLDDVAALIATGAVPQTVNYALKSSFILPLVESVPDLAEKLPKSIAVKDRSGAIENARKAVVLIVGYGNQGDPKGSSSP